MRLDILYIGEEDEGTHLISLYIGEEDGGTHLISLYIGEEDEGPTLSIPQCALIYYI